MIERLRRKKRFIWINYNVSIFENFKHGRKFLIEFFVESPADDFFLLFFRKFNKIHRISRNSYRELRIFPRFLHRIFQNLSIQNIHIDVMPTFFEIAI